MTARHPYARAAYAAALGGAGVLDLPSWRTAIVTRPIAAGGMDGIGPYPMTVIGPDADIGAGLAELRQAGLVSLVLVADPLHGPPISSMGKAFDLARPFKTHHLVRAATYAPNKHHRAEIRRAQARCTVEAVRLADTIEVWTRLYAGLVQRHDIGGAADFGQAYVRHLAHMPELVALAARVDGEIVAMSLWFEHEGVAYNHLGASGPAGYAVGASYALYDAAVARFGHCRAVNLGGGAGASDDQGDGLARFKRGFANDTAIAWLYGKVLDAARYAELSAGIRTDYFPAYRDPAGLSSLRTTSPTLSMSAAP